MDSRPPTTSLKSIDFDVNGLYIVLSNMDQAYLFHWGLFLAKTSKAGTNFHITNGLTTRYKWKYESKPNRNLNESRTLLFASKIAVLDPALHEPLAEQLAAVPIASSPRYGSISCRVWVKEALATLDDLGFIKLTEDLYIIETHLVDKAEEYRGMRNRDVEKNSGSQA